MAAAIVPAIPSAATFPCPKAAALKDWTGGAYRQRQPFGKLRGPVPPVVPRLTHEEFVRLLDEFGKGLDLPPLPADWSRGYLYDDHD